MSAEEMATAGLSKLSPQELAALNTLAERYRQNGRPVTSQATATAQSSGPGKASPSWVGALLTLERMSRQPDKENTLESRLTGDFTGWSGRTSFQLENGQRWAQANNDTYAFTPALPSPRVKIYPAAFGTFWLEIEGTGQRCRVKPVKLE